MKRHQRIQAGAIALSVSILMCPKADAFTFTSIADTSGISNVKSISPGLSTAWNGSTTGIWGTEILNRLDPDANSQYLGSAFQNQMGLAFNNKGQTAYFAQLEGGVTALKLYDPTASTLLRNRTIATTNAYSSFLPGISINEKGEVAFSAIDKNGNKSIFVGNGKTTEPKLIASSSASTIFSSFAPGLSINDNGRVAFWGNLKSGGKEVFTGNGSTIAQITNCSGSSTIATSNGVECPINAQRPSINNKEQVAFVGDNGVFMWEAGVIYDIFSDTTNFKNGYFHDPNINDMGRVSFGATPDDISKTSTLLTSDGNTAYLIAGNTEPIHSIGRSASINNMGEMAFLAEWNGYRDGQGHGIFTGMPDYMSPLYGGNNLKARADMMAKDKVIAVGNTMKGLTSPELISPIIALSMDRESRNDQDQITFWAKLANGIEGIFRANPEPGDGQTNPLMPTSGTTGKDGTLWSFINTPGRIWYDPIPAEGFNFKMNSDSLFTEIMNFPANFTKPFLLAVKDVVLGEFTAGDKVKFSDYSDLLGDLLKDSFGVKEFTISGISVDASSPTAFPIKLDFSTETASFDMIAMLSKSESDYNNGSHRIGGYPGDEGSEPVPEPTTMLGMVLFGAVAAKLKRQRASAKKAV